jgi:hypothetical protein
VCVVLAMKVHSPVASHDNIKSLLLMASVEDAKTTSISVGCTPMQHEFFSVVRLGVGTPACLRPSRVHLFVLFVLLPEVMPERNRAVSLDVAVSQDLPVQRRANQSEFCSCITSNA